MPLKVNLPDLLALEVLEFAWLDEEGCQWNIISTFSKAPSRAM